MKHLSVFAAIASEVVANLVYEKAHPCEKWKIVVVFLYFLQAFINELCMADKKENKNKMDILWQNYSTEQKVR